MLNYWTAARPRDQRRKRWCAMLRSELTVIAPHAAMSAATRRGMLMRATDSARASDRSRRDFLETIGGGITAAALVGGCAVTSAAPGNDASSPVTGDNDPKTVVFDAMMTDFMHKYQPPGAALAVTKDGRLVYARGFGYADMESKEPVRRLRLGRSSDRGTAR
jgi:CubicO group peptidase (beta-lactamase class C family)